MTKRLRQLGLTPAKGALIALLAVGLLAVWGPTVAKLLKPSGSQPAAQAAEPVRRARVAGPRPTAPSTPAPVVEPKRSPNERRPMPAIGLAEATPLDPFAIPAWSPQARTAAERIVAAEENNVEAKFASLRELGVAMVLVSGGEQVVQIGGQMLRVGDEIQGFRIVEINDSGVVFRPVDPREKARGV